MSEESDAGGGSSSNLATVRRLADAFNARDVDAFITELDPTAEIEPLRAQLEDKRYRGEEGVREMFADFDEDWENLRIEIDALEEVGDRVALLGRLLARGRASGVDLDVPIGFVWTLRDGRLVHGKTFSEQADALRAARLD